jgi:hypothetical protein
MNAQIKMAYLALGLCLTISHAPNAFAEVGGVAGGGGDEVGMMFLSSAFGVAVEIKDQAANFPELAGIDLLAVAQSASVTVSDAPLLAKLPDGTSQESIALNFPTSGRIKVNRTRWEHLSNEFVRRGIALHELLGLKGIESTGNYPYSGRYLATHGYDLNVFKVTPILRPGTYVPIMPEYGSKVCAFEIEVNEATNQIFLTNTFEAASGKPCKYPTVIGQCKDVIGRHCVIERGFKLGRYDYSPAIIDLLPDGNLTVDITADKRDPSITKYRFASEKLLKPWAFVTTVVFNEKLADNPQTCAAQAAEAKIQFLEKCRLEAGSPNKCRITKSLGGYWSKRSSTDGYISSIPYCQSLYLEARAD